MAEADSTDTAQITVGDTPLPDGDDARAVGDSPVAKLLASVADEARREELEKLWRKHEEAEEIAQHRWAIACGAHRLEDGVSRLDFKSRPFQKAIYKDASMDLVLVGSAQGPGKTEFMICDMAASAAYGLKVLVVTSTRPKREKFNGSRLSPALKQVPLYKQMLEAAKNRGADTDSASLKHFGMGWINLISSTVARDFTSYPSDKAIIDEHQECNQQNLRLIDDRMSGSKEGYMVRIGHPTTDGTAQNQNLNWLYKHSSQHLWTIPCGTCGADLVLDWWQHVVHEKLNPGGGIESIRPRDEEWRPGGPLDLRPVCNHCHRPVNRLAGEDRGARWVARYPNHERHGYKFSNIWAAPHQRLDKLYVRYDEAKYSAVDRGEIINKQLGETFSVDGNRVTDQMLAMCAGGDVTKVAPYKFVPVSQMQWRRLSDA